MSSRLFRSFATVGSWTMLSRFLGFARDMLMSRILGAGPMADAFNSAFQLPNMFRRFLAEGAFNSAFVPMFRKRSDDPIVAEQFAQNAFSSLFVVLIALIVVVQIFTPLAIAGLSSGFIGTPRFDMAQNYLRITIFYIFFMSLSALCSGVLNSFGKFGVAAAAPALLNVALISALVYSYYFQATDIGMVLSYGVFIGGALQLIWLFYGARKAGVKLKLHWPKWNADMYQLLTIALPATLTAGVAQINLVVGRQIASFTDGAVSWLGYADRVYQLPLGVVGVAIGVVLLPSLASFVKANDEVGAHKQFNQSISFSMLLTLPAAFAIFAIALPIVSILYEGGKFTHASSVATANALSIYALALPAFVLQKCLLPLFFAREDTKTPLKYAICDMLLNLFVSLVLWKYLDYLAPVVGSLVSGWFMVIMLWFGSRKFGQASKLSKETFALIAKFTLASTIAAVFAWAVSMMFPAAFTGGLLKWVALLALIGMTMVIYFSIVMVIAKIHPRDLKTIARR